MSYLLLLATVIAGPTVNAHELGIARVTVDWNEFGKLHIEARLPTGSSGIAPIVPSRCKPAGSAVYPGLVSDVDASWQFDCGSNAIGPRDVVRLNWPLEGVFVTTRGMDNEGRFFDEKDGQILLPLRDVVGEESQPTISFSQYFGFGVEHILTGWDHLAFVLALCLVAAGWPLVKLVTAFTVGHSITLGLASAGFLSVPAPPLEALIALSIAFMAREAVLRGKHSHSYSIVLGFGLLHGLGFAGALSDFGLQEGNLLKALLAFNAGVEVGQLIFVMVAVALLELARFVFQPARVSYVAAHGIGILAVFWTLERVAGFSA